MFRKKASYLLVVTGFGFLLNACDDLIPVFRKEPIIGYKDINRFYVLDPNASGPAYRDSVSITITFQDGDGDLGLAPSDTLPPFQDDPGNLYFYNYYITGFKKVNGNFKPVVLPSFGFGPQPTLNGRFPLLKPDGEPGPIEGNLDYGFIIEFPPDNSNELYIYPGDTLQFEVFIYDRAQNQSNTIRTEEIVVLQP